MKRRDAVKSLAVAGMTSGAFGLPRAGRAPLSRTADLLVEKVKLAMLTMQRQAWEQGVAAQALLELGEESLVILMAKEAVIRIWDDGRLGQVCDNHGVTDPGANGEAVLWAARKTGDPGLEAAAERMLDYFLHKAPRRKDGTLYHIDDKPQVWVDSMYMAPPFLGVAGQPEEALRQVEGLRRLLWNKDHKLFSHIWDDAKNDFGRKAFWGVGNGWAAAGMTRVLKALPERMTAERSRLRDYIRDVLDGCLAHQRPDGLFHDVLDDPKAFVEVNLAQMLAYTIYRGLKAGWHDARYKAKADTMRRAARAKVDGFGLVQDVCGSPTFEAPGTATEGQAFFLLMEAAARDLAV
ncbi:MAG TPA: glycoside hydrolase family 88 protein [Burkholderiales bacterium]|nr:glycoside hydrolase family 88 protein [Burkholderiales bacterium]